VRATLSAFRIAARQAQARKGPFRSLTPRTVTAWYSMPSTGSRATAHRAGFRASLACYRGDMCPQVSPGEDADTYMLLPYRRPYVRNYAGTPRPPVSDKIPPLAGRHRPSAGHETLQKERFDLSRG
jgi:hypothetical protein